MGCEQDRSKKQGFNWVEALLAMVLMIPLKVGMLS